MKPVFSTLLNFQYQGAKLQKSFILYQYKHSFHYYLVKNGVLLSPLCRRASMKSRKKILKLQVLETYKMPSKEILRIRNCIHITLISYFHLQLVSKSVSWKILGLKLVKVGYIIIYLDLDTIKKARYELDGACGLPLVF